jgi:acetylglutamate synthase
MTKIKFIHTTKIEPSLQKKLFETIEESFKKKLNPNFPNRKLQGAIYTHNFSCAGLISLIDNFFYLDKLAVVSKFRGQGLGTSLLDEIINTYSPIIWRSSDTNPFLEFYKNKASLKKKTKLWNIFEFNQTHTTSEYIYNTISNINSDFI